MAPLVPRQTTSPDQDPSATAAPPTDYTSVDSRADIYGGGHHNGLTNAHIGAIIGSIIGFTLIVLILIFCAVNRRKEQRRRYRHRYHHERSSSDSSTSGGSSYSFYRGRGGVRKPPSAKTRRSAAAAVDGERVWHEGYAGGGKMGERERIPGGPKWPTYRAIPIPNPRRNPNLRRHV